MACLFLFGAGASYGSGPCWPQRPPLGRDLFAELRKRGGEAAAVDDYLAKVFALDFEKGMDQFVETRELRVTALLREMGAYFAQFEPRAGNYYGELVTILAKARRQATFVSLNYDLLFEMAATQVGIKVAYRGQPVNRDTVSLLKIHGSCNFLPDVGTNIVEGNIHGTLRGPHANHAFVRAPVRPAWYATEVIEFCSREGGMAPAIALYAESKRVLYCPAFVEEQRMQWNRAVDKASVVYLIGIHVHETDNHVWGPLAQTRAPMYYVGREPEEFQSWALGSRGKGQRSYVLADSFQAALPLIGRHLDR